MIKLCGLWLCCIILVGVAPVVGASVFDFGAIPDDGQDDTAAFQAAVNQGGTIRVPAGVYQIAVSGKTAINCSRSVRLLGEGRDRSIIRFESELTATGTGFLFRPDTLATVERLVIEGPEKTSKFACNLLVHYGGPLGVLRIDQCRLAGGTIAAKMEELGGKQEQPRMVVLDSLIQSPTGLLMLNSGCLDVARTEFKSYGTLGSNQAHAIYVYRPVSLIVNRCVFRGNVGEGFEIHSYSSAVSGKGGVVVCDSEFGESALGRGILCHSETLTVIRGCRLGGTVIWTQKGGTIISESTLKSKSQAKPWPYNPGTPSFRDCRFGGD